MKLANPNMLPEELEGVSLRITAVHRYPADGIGVKYTLSLVAEPVAPALEVGTVVETKGMVYGVIEESHRDYYTVRRMIPPSGRASYTPKQISAYGDEVPESARKEIRRLLASES